MFGGSPIRLNARHAVTLQQLTQALGELDDRQLEDVARYVSYVRLRGRLPSTANLSEADLKALYAEAGDEDRDLAEAGISDYAVGLIREDAK
jgi:hypothetical protein